MHAQHSDACTLLVFGDIVGQGDVCVDRLLSSPYGLLKREI